MRYRIVVPRRICEQLAGAAQDRADDFLLAALWQLVQDASEEPGQTTIALAYPGPHYDRLLAFAYTVRDSLPPLKFSTTPAERAQTSSDRAAVNKLLRRLDAIKTGGAPAPAANRSTEGDT